MTILAALTLQERYDGAVRFLATIQRLHGIEALTDGHVELAASEFTHGGIKGADFEVLVEMLFACSSVPVAS